MIKRTMINLELALVAEAQQILGTRGTADTIHRALQNVVRHAKLRALADETFEDLTPEALRELRPWRPERWQSE